MRKIILNFMLVSMFIGKHSNAMDAIDKVKGGKNTSFMISEKIDSLIKDKPDCVRGLLEYYINMYGLPSEILAQVHGRISKLQQKKEADSTSNSEDWFHITQVIAYDTDKLEILNNGGGNETFKKNTIPYILKDIQTLMSTYTLESLKKFKEIQEFIKLLEKQRSYENVEQIIKSLKNEE